MRSQDCYSFPITQTLIKTQSTIITQEVPLCPFPVILHVLLSKGNHSFDFFLQNFPVLSLYLNRIAMV